MRIRSTCRPAPSRRTARRARCLYGQGRLLDVLGRHDEVFVGVLEGAEPALWRVTVATGEATSLLGGEVTAPRAAAAMLAATLDRLTKPEAAYALADRLVGEFVLTDVDVRMWYLDWRLGLR